MEGMYMYITIRNYFQCMTLYWQKQQCVMYT